MRGHAIECRINAEDPGKNFAPRPGEISIYYPPGGHGIRVDSHAYGGYSVPPYYDSMVAKIIAHGPDRETAKRKMDAALSSYIIRGMPTTISYQRAIMRDPHNQKGNFTTHCVEEISSRNPVDPLKYGSQKAD
jgi:acetyl-CoA carboxylase biotin carboxylase subunit